MKREIQVIDTRNARELLSILIAPAADDKWFILSAVLAPNDDVHVLLPADGMDQLRRNLKHALATKKNVPIGPEPIVRQPTQPNNVDGIPIAVDMDVISKELTGLIVVLQLQDETQLAFRIPWQFAKELAESLRDVPRQVG